MTAVLFDLDGTALDSEPDFTAVLRQMQSRAGVESISAADVRRTITRGGRALATLLCPEEHAEFERILAEFLDAYAVQVRSSLALPYPGMAQLIDHLNTEGRTWGIVTNKSQRFTLPLLEAQPLFERCAVTVCADQVKQSKPAPDALLLACDTLGLPSSHCIYVGDHRRDIDAGRAAGMRTVAAAWGYIPDEDPAAQWRADWLAQRPEDIIDYLQQLNSHPSGLISPAQQ